MGDRMRSDLNNLYRIRSVFYERCRFPMKSDADSIENDRISWSDWISWVDNKMHSAIGQYTNNLTFLKLQKNNVFYKTTDDIPA
jgi:hypothetical protein